MQTGKLEPLVTALEENEEEQMKNMLRRVDYIAKVLHCVLNKQARDIIYLNSNSSFF